jgi:hypothetical protein
MRQIVCSGTRAVVLTACVMMGVLSTCAWASPITTISDSGKSLISVFEGLKANPRLANYQPLKPWRGMLQGRLPGVLSVRFTDGAYCPTSTCEGNYATFGPNPGGCISTGCESVEDFVTDTQQGSCYDGAMDVECGGGDAGPCCANWVLCPATNTIGCHN